MLEYIQDDFSGGMNLFDSTLRIGANEYGLAFNIRNRTGELATIQAPVLDDDAPSGLKQGIYGFDRYIILFNSGAAFYKDIIADGDWTQIVDFALKVDAPTIYLEAVPASTQNFERKLVSNDNADGTITNPNLKVNPIILGNTVAGAVCQDGSTRPMLILADGTARRLGDYTDWTKSNREYVPLMKQMKFFNGILFGIAPDGINILRSVSGRPLDFVVNVKADGDKGGKADTVSYNVGYNPVTCLDALNSGHLFVSTTKTCHPIELNYDKTIFAEPTFRNLRAFNASVVNQFSFIDILSDYTFIDTDGIRSFNAVASQENEGRNSIFSSRISKAFAGIKQEVCAAVVFDNYSIFSVETIYGNVLAIYDNSRAVWVCFDNVGFTVKQFAVANQSSNPTLYCITTDNKVYKLYSSATELEAQVYFRALCSGKPSAGIKLSRFYAAFDGGTTESVAALTEIVDNKVKATVRRTLNGDTECDPILFDFDGEALEGWKVQPKLVWQNEAKIPIVEAQAIATTALTTTKQTAQLYNG